MLKRGKYKLLHWKDMQVVMGFLVPGFYYGNFSFSDLMQILAWAGPDVLAARLPVSINAFLKDNLLAKVAAMQLAYATDTNIPNDSKYSFVIVQRYYILSSIV